MKGVPYVSSICRTLREEPPRDAAIARLAEHQHGVVSLAQLQSAGLSASAVRSRVAAGRLTRTHRAVYAVGHAPLTIEGRLLAAVLACGPGAVLSHRSAGAHLGLRPDNRARIDVTVPGRSARPRAGIDVHASLTLGPQDVTVHETIPCTSVARTILDLAEHVDRRGVERAIDQAERLRLFDLETVEDVLSRSAGRRGAPVLRAVLAAYRGPTLTDEELEELFLAICRTAGLPQPEVNAWMVLDDDAVKADFLWRDQRLVVETDGWASHGTRRAFASDRRRDRRLRLAGWETCRFTWYEVADEPAEVGATLRRLLELRTR